MTGSGIGDGHKEYFAGDATLKILAKIIWWGGLLRSESSATNKDEQYTGRELSRPFLFARWK